MMKEIKWTHIHPLADETLLDEFEADYDVKLPKSLRETVRRNNAGWPEPAGFNLPGGDRSEMKHLLSFLREDKRNIWKQNPVVGFDPGLIAFAVDPFGSKICLDSGTGEIKFADTDTNELVLLAADFDSFLRALS